MTDEVAPDPMFTVLRPTYGDFVMVLDRSGSMDLNNNGRLDRLKQAAVRWIQLDIQEGSWLGITSFRFLSLSFMIMANGIEKDQRLSVF